MEHGPGCDGPVRLIVAVAATPPWREPARPGRRLLEWSLLAVVVLVIVLLFLRQGQQVQGQAELASIKTTLGALRTAAVMDDLQGRARGRPAATVTNPFELLQPPPLNYLGVLGSGQVSTLHPGSWWFDPQCSCAVYAPIEQRWLAGGAGEPLLRFRVFTAGGPMQLAALETYLWQGQRVD